jgi:hypothetical protein
LIRVRFVHFIRYSVLAAGILTSAYIVFIVGWQITIFVHDGIWPHLTVSSALDLLNHNHGHDYETQATRSIRGANMDELTDALLGLPATMPLFVAAILLAVFYFYLRRVAKGVEK